MVKLFRAALLGAALLVSASAVSFADDVPLSADIIAQINTAAGTNSDPAAYAAAIAVIVKANPDLAAQIAGQATQTKPAAATFIATSVAAVAPPAAAAAVVNAIVAQVAPADKATVGATIVSNYIASAPPAAVNIIAAALTPVLNTITDSAAGGNNNNQQLINNALDSNAQKHSSES